jgi:hypothetical protein
MMRMDVLVMVLSNWSFIPTLSTSDCDGRIHTCAVGSHYAEAADASCVATHVLTWSVWVCVCAGASLRRHALVASAALDNPVSKCSHILSTTCCMIARATTALYALMSTGTLVLCDAASPHVPHRLHGDAAPSLRVVNMPQPQH